jgi:hypothetical protein
MASLDREIDQLYQLPLSEFTPGRNALAKGNADHRALVSRLQKPSVPAWAVNQLYWRDRKTYDALVRASERVRATQTRALKGGQANVAGAEAAHGAAVKSASEAVREILRAAGEAESPATMNAVLETLRALPIDGTPGRLTRPLKPLGFEALAGLLKGKLPRSRAAVLPFKTTSKPTAATDDKAAAKRAAAQAKREAEQAKRDAQTQAKEIAKLQRDLRQAQAAEASAVDNVKRARAAVEKAEQEVERRREASADATMKRQKIQSALKQLGIEP